MRRTTVDDLTARRLGLPLSFDRKALQQAQMTRLRETVRWARSRSLFYHQRLKDIDPDRLNSPADLGQLPLQTVADITANPLDLLCLSQSRVARIVTLETSGSTGVPKRVFFTGDDLDATLEFFHDGMLSLISAGDRVLVLLPASQPDSVGDLLVRALSGGGFGSSAIWPPPAASVLAAEVERRSSTCVVGLPLHLLALAEVLPPGHAVRSMLLCSDYAPVSVRRRIEKACGCTTFLHYGATETGLGGGVECDVHRGCHLRESDLLVEIIHPESGMPLPDGEMGEIAVTTISRRGMPLIRYRTGDLARLDRTPCPCGGVTARLDDIRGRASGCRLAGGRELFSQDLDEVLFGIGGISDFQATIHPGDPELLSIEYLSGRGYPAREDIRRELLALPVIRQAMREGRLEIGAIQPVSTFSVNHRVKRSICDQRQ